MNMLFIVYVCYSSLSFRHFRTWSKRLLHLIKVTKHAPPQTIEQFFGAKTGLITKSCAVITSLCFVFFLDLHYFKLIDFHSDYEVSEDEKTSSVPNQFEINTCGYILIYIKGMIKYFNLKEILTYTNVT